MTQIIDDIESELDRFIESIKSQFKSKTEDIINNEKNIYENLNLKI